MFRTDCLHWEGYKPCKPIKNSLTRGCLECTQFQEVRENILILEAGGLGSIVRATGLAKALKEKSEGVKITWLTHQHGAELLAHCPSVDEVLVGVEEDYLYQIRLFKEIVKPMQSLNEKVLYDLTPNIEVQEFVNSWLSSKNIDKNTYKIGLDIDSLNNQVNPWHLNQFLQLVKILKKQINDVTFIIMSSSINKEYLNKVQGQIIYRLPNLINKPTILHTNENNSISFLLSLINSIDSLISTDSFYNQLGLAFGKKVFTPPSPSNPQPPCMSSISPEHIARQLIDWYNKP